MKKLVKVEEVSGEGLIGLMGALPHDWYVQLSAVESYGKLK